MQKQRHMVFLPDLRHVMEIPSTYFYFIIILLSLKIHVHFPLFSFMACPLIYVLNTEMIPDCPISNMTKRNYISNNIIVTSINILIV